MIDSEGPRIVIDKNHILVQLCLGYMYKHLFHHTVNWSCLEHCNYMLYNLNNKQFNIISIDVNVDCYGWLLI